MHIGNGHKIDVDVRADSQTIKDVLRGLAVMATAQSSGNTIGTSEFADIFNSGITAATNGTSGLISLEGNLGIFSETLEKANARNQFEALSLSAAYQTLTGRDQFEAAAELKQLEVQLESSYIITARLSGLTLTNYLR
jgi:flagellar hook-associated protein 3 FlgL